MHSIIIKMVRLCVIGVPLLWSANSLAKKEYESHQRQGRDQGRSESPIRRMEQDTGGTVLNSEQVERDGQVYQKMKILVPGGKVKTIYVPAR